MKRGGDQLTGGSKDVNPQVLVTATVTSTVADNFAQIGVPLPIPRLPTKSGKNLVMEFLYVDFAFTTLAIHVSAFDQYYLDIGTRSNFVRSNGLTGIIQGMQDPTTIAYYRFAIITPATNDTVEVPVDKRIDLTDGAGHGILVATDQCTVSVNSDSTGAVCGGFARVTYRWKEVSLVEYIGIVQSQQ